MNVCVLCNEMKFESPAPSLLFPPARPVVASPTRPPSIGRVIGSPPLARQSLMDLASVLIRRKRFSNAEGVQSPPKHFATSEVTGSDRGSNDGSRKFVSSSRTVEGAAGEMPQEGTDRSHVVRE